MSTLQGSAGKGRGENFVNQRAVFREKTIDLRFAFPQAAREDNAIGAGSHPVEASQGTLQGFDVPGFLLKVAQGETEFLAGFRGQRSTKRKNLGG